VNKKVVTTRELMDVSTSLAAPWLEKTEYPWEVLPQIKEIVTKLIESGDLKALGYTEIQPGVWAGEGVTIAKTAEIKAPAILGPRTEVRPGAFLRGNVLTGADCVLGNSSEFKNALLLDHVQAPHYNYVGDSVLGNYAHMGAGSICSNLKSGGSNVVVHGDEDYETGLRKFGAILGDHADVGCGSVLNPGTVIGQGSRIYPLTSVRGVVPEKSIMKSATEVVDFIKE